MTLTYTPKKNLIAKRMNKTILERARCMLISLGLPKIFWREAVTCYLIKRNLSSALNYKIHDQMQIGTVPDYLYIRTFGCAAYAFQIES